MKHYLAIVLTLALAGCWSYQYPAFPPAPPPPMVPVPPPLPPVEPPVEPVPPTDPLPPPPTGERFDEVVVGMSRSEVVALVGLPTIDPPENPNERFDAVIYERPGGAWIIAYQNNLVARKVWATTGPVR